MDESILLTRNMKSFKPLLRLTGMIAAVALATTPVAAFAQNQGAQQNRPRIVFNQDQQAQFEKLQADTIAKINATLSAQQRAQLEAGIQNGQGFNSVENLTETQRNELRVILTDFNNGIGNILTDEQKREIEKFQQNQ